MSKLFSFGETVEGYSVPVLNEREVRASAGILFLFAFFSLMLIAFRGNFLVAKFFVILFLIDFIIRVYVNPKFSPSLIIGKLIVSKQEPEYVGAPQKKFAWTIGIWLAASMFVLLIVLNTYSIITGLICLICLIFLFFESVFGICLGCIFYNFIYKKKAQHCPGNSCEIEKKTAPKTSLIQLAIVFIFAALIFVMAFFLTNTLKEKPSNLWVKLGIKKEAVLPHNSQ